MRPRPSERPASHSNRLRQQGNRLLEERSEYLRQHAFNPVDWHTWGPEALDRAAREDKPIFLSIGYSSCHWCHVMEREVFEDDEVAALLNEHFVCVKVDREERPDLDQVYMESLVAMTGSGGWPMSLFLSPAQRPFWGGTYLPRPAFLSVARRLLELYASERGAVESVGERLVAYLARASADEAGGGVLSDELHREAGAQAARHYDEVWGGFGSHTKFPMPVRWRYLLHLYRRTGDPRLERMLRRTLDAMASGGMQDHVAGGFHRYSVDRQWLVPHFEKMLYDNALLAGLYVQASAVFREERYEEVARDTLDFLLRDMRSEQGAFTASFDADSDGEEGSFYVWTPEELRELVGEEDGVALAAILGVEPGGNFEGRSILTRRRDLGPLAKTLGRSEEDLGSLFRTHREALLRHRATRPAPRRDRKVITAWNGLAIAALAEASSVLGEPRYAAAAARAADFLWATHRSPAGRLRRASNLGEAEHEGILDDYAFFAKGLLALYQATGALTHYDRALALLEVAERDFRRAEGGYYLTPADHPAPMGRPVQLQDGVRPSGSAVLLEARLEVAALSGDEAGYRRVEEELTLRGGAMRRQGIELSSSLDLALRWAGPHREVVIAGAPEDGSARALERAVRGAAPPHAVLVRVGVEGATAEQLRRMPALRGKRALDGEATAFVCERGRCEAPTNQPEVLLGQLMAGWVG